MCLTSNYDFGRTCTCKCLKSNDCRCLYSTAPIVLLDAPFTAIDNKLKQSIMEKVATILTRLRLIFFINAKRKH